MNKKSEVAKKESKLASESGVEHTRATYNNTVEKNGGWTGNIESGVAHTRATYNNTIEKTAGWTGV